MRVLGRCVLVIAVLLTVAAPATAGSEQSPEMRDECAGYVHSVEGATAVRHASLDLCKGWFAFPSAPSGAPALRLTLQTNTAPSQGVENLYVAGWRSGGCAYQVVVDGAVGVDEPYWFSGDCQGPGEETCTVQQLAINCSRESNATRVPLPADAVAWDDDQLSISLAFDGPLAQFAGHHRAGDVLTDVTAWSAQGLGPGHIYSHGCSFGFSDRCYELAGDVMRSLDDVSVGG